MWGADFGFPAALVLMSLVGVALGLLGGGGSILTVPILVYVAGFPAREAVALSLAIIGLTSLAGGLIQWWKGQVHLQAAGLFSATGMVGAALGARATPLVPAPLLLTAFGILVLFIGGRMLLGRDQTGEPQDAACRPWRCAGAGWVLGLLTGFLGVGGGFLLVPALMRFAHLPTHRAAATSLVIIAVNSAAGFASHAGAVETPAAGIGALLAAAMVGMGLGLAGASRVDPARLKVGFGGLAATIGLYQLVMGVLALVRQAR